MSIPQRICASRAVNNAERYAGTLPLDRLARLREAAVAGTDGQVVAEVQAGREAGGSWLRGSLTVALGLRCRRCEKVYTWAPALPLALRLVYSEEEEERWLAECEPYRVEDDVLPLQAMVEEEVLLSLPMLPLCQTCENSDPAPVTTGPVPVEVPEARRNPFAQLKLK